MQITGSIDCTHIKIQSPGGDDAEVFRNRKGYFSLNVQTVSDAKLKILNIVCRWPGSTHDSAIFQNSRLCYQFETGVHAAGLHLGDNGYPLKNYLMTPFLSPQTIGQQNYNRAHIATRNTVEQQYGVLKRRFPVLATGLRLKLENSINVILACSVLHNICIDKNEDVPPVEVENIENDIQNGQMERNIQNGQNNLSRDILVARHFQ
ncbi:unnamed protein product [Acanthoscelides obtectus]|uniref:DDE Tnp4 domain-containing protein n=2 Tax=Acanthoscelides obtectus TaxID=200917 RepID=A0A9P0PAY6_ACAOB|nr:unnamed protein product [Acanthoscelides obtectus]CAK1654470.1 Putative nuclease HARBI1 [Acanthoscelides obtectus]